MVEGEGVKLLDHGYLNYEEHYGSDERIVKAARMSTGKGFLGWEPGVCPICDGVGHESSEEAKFACYGCEGKGKIPGDKNLLRRLWVKKHATPFEMAGLIVTVQAPIFVFREWHRHRTQSYNEMSARYTPLPDLNYIQSIERLMQAADAANKQAGTAAGAGILTETVAMQYRDKLALEYHADQKMYEWALAAGIPKELARVHLPVGRYSLMMASANLRNWLAFLTLRMAGDAQWEIRQYANALGDMIAKLFPRTWALFVAGKDGVHLSAAEVKAIHDKLPLNTDSSGERSDFSAKLERLDLGFLDV